MEFPKTFASEEEQGEFIPKNLMGPVDGVWMPTLRPGMTSWQEKIDEIRQMKLRPDDVMLLTYPKCGTHWLWEVITMLRQMRPERIEDSKAAAMIDYVDIDVIDQLPSPRTLNTHLMFCHLPAEEIKTRSGVKSVHVYRNPKDIAVSLYYMAKASPKMFIHLPVDTFHNFIDSFFFSDKQVYGSYFSYLRQMAEFQRQNPHVPICNMAYEDMKKEPVECVKQLAKFLELEVSDELCSQIAEACSFQNMKKEQERKKFPQMSLNSSSQQDAKDAFTSVLHSIFRKGEVGDWKTHFTVADSERVDSLIEREMKDVPYTITFE